MKTCSNFLYDAADLFRSVLHAHGMCTCQLCCSVTFRLRCRRQGRPQRRKLAKTSGSEWLKLKVRLAGFPETSRFHSCHSSRWAVSTVMRSDAIAGLQIDASSIKGTLLQSQKNAEAWEL